MLRFEKSVGNTRFFIFDDSAKISHMIGWVNHEGLISTTHATVIQIQQILEFMHAEAA